MTQLLIRSAEFDISNDGRNLTGLAFRWETPSMVSDPGTGPYLEEFSKRSADRSVSERRQRALFVEHQHIAGSVGEVSFEPSAEGLVFRARMSDTTYATETLERVNKRELLGVSVGFKPLHHRKRSSPRGLVTTRTEVAIVEMSLCKVPQHDGAGVLSVRSSSTPRLDELRRRRVVLL